MVRWPPVWRHPSEVTASADPAADTDGVSRHSVSIERNQKPLRQTSEGVASDRPFVSGRRRASERIGQHHLGGEETEDQGSS